VVTRLEGTSIRIRHYIDKTSDNLASERVDGNWSIKEHIGHLIDLEFLHRHRLDEFAALKPELTMADMSNARTNEADHNERSTSSLVEEFVEKRGEFLDRFYSLKDEHLLHQAIHPRLKIPMRPVDMLFFTAEHDDHHVTSIVELLKKT